KTAVPLVRVSVAGGSSDRSSQLRSWSGRTRVRRFDVLSRRGQTHPGNTRDPPHWFRRYSERPGYRGRWFWRSGATRAAHQSRPGSRQPIHGKQIPRRVRRSDSWGRKQRALPMTYELAKPALIDVPVKEWNGAPGMTRTCDLLVRSQKPPYFQRLPRLIN